MKRSTILLLTAALIAGALTAPARAEGEPGSTGGVVPATPNIVDAANDANLHSSLSGNGAPPSQTGADILAVWFTNDATNLYTHIQASTNARLESLTFITYVGPAAGTDCMQLRLTTEGEGVEPFSSLTLSGDCGTSTTAYGPLLEEVGPDDTTILTGAFPLTDIQAVATDKLLAEPDALVGYNLRNATRGLGSSTTPPLGRTSRSPTTAAAPEKPAKPVKPAKPAKPTKPTTPVKNGCDKGKGKKKGCTKPPKTPKPEACTPATYAEQGAEKPTLVLADTATEAAPVEQAVTLEPSVGDLDQTGEVDHGSFDYFNVQVDTASTEAGLYALIEFPERRDYDIDLLHADGSYAARSHDWNTVLGAPLDFGVNGGHGGESTTTTEKLVGIRTTDCGGYTIEVAN